MILVLLGTQNNDFSRLLIEIEKNIKEKNIKEEIIVQAGYTKYKSKNMKVLGLMSSKKLEKYIDEANFVISHGGVGSILQCVKKGKKVIAVPRISKYGEHVNDHQKQIIKLFDEQGYVIGINDVSELADALLKVEGFIPNIYVSNTKKMIQIIEEFIM